MHPLSVLLVLVTAAAGGVYGHPAAATGTPAARFWEEALPGTPMPEAIADLAQQGIDHSPLVEHYSLPDYYKGLQSDQVASTKVVYKGLQPDQVASTKVVYKGLQLDQVASTKVVYKDLQPDQVASTKVVYKGLQPDQVASTKVVYKGLQTDQVASTKIMYKGLQPDQVASTKVVYKGLQLQPDQVASTKVVYKASSSGNKATEPLPPRIFFLQAQVHPGSTMTTFFEPAAVSPILPRDVAQRVPFRNQADVLATFHIAPSSAEAAAVAHTLSLCQASPPLTAAVVGEQRACTTSLEGTVQSSMHMLGTTQGVWAASSALPRGGLPLQPFVVEAVTALDGDQHVGCHSLSFPYAVYYCHSTGLPSKAYMVSLRSVRGGSPPVTLAAICHLDTSNWDPEHMAFKMLNTKPGGAPVCHFMSYASLLFGEKAAKP